jgi:hypothetical protein
MHRLKSYGTFVPTYGHKGYLVELFDKGSIRYLIWEPKANMATLEAQSKAEAERVIEADIAEKQALLWELTISNGATASEEAAQ